VTSDRDALITGIGLVSCLGEGVDAHWSALTNPDGFTPILETERFAPYAVHPMVALDWEKQIPRREQRQMEPWQRIGVYAAGQALHSAGVKGNAALLERMDMIVAAGGGERDYAADEGIIAALRTNADPAVTLNQHLQSDLRPTLFLAQLSNLLAGNISLVHGVVGSSRTFMGEELAGAEAIRTACARIAAGQGDLFLVGGSFNAERPDSLMLHAFGGALWRHAPEAAGAGHASAPVWARQVAGGGMVAGSVGCFLVIESRAHAAGRGATPIARIAAVVADRCRRRPAEATATAQRQLAAIHPGLETNHAAVISGASGVAAATLEEAAFLRALHLPVRAAATALGHSLEASFPASLALAAMAVAKGRLFLRLEQDEEAMPGELRQALVTGWGLWRGEAMALVDDA
jgi:3-oxoacyl-[acyl-carrier-protein] synthase II